MLTAGAGFLGLAFVLYAHWFEPYAGWGIRRGALALTVTGLAVLFYRHLFKERAGASDETVEPSVGSASIYLWGYENNLAFAQGLAVAVMVVSIFRWEIDAAWYAGLTAAVLTPLLFNTRLRAATLTLGAVGLGYLIYSLTAHTMAYEMEASTRAIGMPQYLIPPGPFVWTLILIALFPQLQLLRVGKLGVGSLRGDFHVKLFGSSVPVAFMSAVLLVCGWAAILEVRGALQWAVRLMGG